MKKSSAFLERHPEMSFSEPARRFLDGLIRSVRGGDRFSSFRVEGISVFEAGAAPLILYYLQKACRYAAAASDLLDSVRPDSLRIESLESELAKAVSFEAKRRSMPSPPTAAENGRSAVWEEWAWLAREGWLSMAGTVTRNGRAVPTDFLFLCNVHRQHDSIAPLITELLRRSDGGVCVLSKTAIPARLRVPSERVRYLDWTHLRSPGYFRRLAAAWRRMKKEWDGLVQNTLAHEHPYLVSALESWFHQMAQKTLRALLVAREALDRLGPKVQVVTDPADYEAKSFTLIGALRKIPSLCLQYGLATKLDSEWKYFGQDYLGAFDEASAGVFREHGIPAERIVVTGNPRFDRYRPDEDLRRKVRHELGVPDDRSLVLFLSVPPAPEGVGRIESNLSDAEHRRLLDCVYGLPAADPGWVLAVKPHPEEDASPHGARARGRERVRLVTDRSAYDLLNASDAVITLYSTTGLEAIYLDKPMVLINLTAREDLVDFVPCGAALPVRKEAELVPAIRDLLQDGEVSQKLAAARRAYVLKSRGGDGGTSVGKCAEIVLSLTKGNVCR